MSSLSLAAAAPSVSRFSPSFRLRDGREGGHARRPGPPSPPPHAPHLLQLFAHGGGLELGNGFLAAGLHGVQVHIEHVLEAVQGRLGLIVLPEGAGLGACGESRPRSGHAVRGRLQPRRGPARLGRNRGAPRLQPGSKAKRFGKRRLPAGLLSRPCRSIPRGSAAPAGPTRQAEQGEGQHHGSHLRAGPAGRAERGSWARGAGAEPARRG